MGCCGGAGGTGEGRVQGLAGVVAVVMDSTEDALTSPGVGGASFLATSSAIFSSHKTHHVDVHGLHTTRITTHVTV